MQEKNYIYDSAEPLLYIELLSDCKYKKKQLHCSSQRDKKILLALQGW